jgi:hypothetical protein
MNHLRAVATTLTVAILAATTAGAELEPALATVSHLIDCSPSDLDRLTEGEIVSVRPDETVWNEGAAVLVSGSPTAVLEAMKRADFLHANRRVVTIWDMSRVPPGAPVLSSLPIDTVGLIDPATGEPVGDWNLSATERALLSDVERDGEGGKGLAVGILHILAERAAAYRSGGTRAIASYVRPGGSGVFATGSEAAALWSRYAELDAIAPGVHAAMASFPRPASLRLQHSFFASVVVQDGQSALVLSHRAESAAESYAIEIEREFYVSRVYGVRQTIIGAAEVPGNRSVAFYLSSVAGSEAPPRTSSARVNPSQVEPLLAQLKTLGGRAH